MTLVFVLFLIKEIYFGYSIDASTKCDLNKPYGRLNRKKCQIKNKLCRRFNLSNLTVPKTPHYSKMI